MNALNNANIQDNTSSGPASFAFPEAKSSKTGVSVRFALDETRQWYVLRIKYGKTQAVADSIIEDGTYDELIEKGGYFAELVERQRLDLSAAPANDGTAPADNDPAPEDDGAAPTDTVR
jgi:hypothetical protein